MSDPTTTRTEDELLAAVLALTEAQKGLEQLRVRQAAVLERLTAKQPAGLEAAPASPAAVTELRRAEDKIAAARVRFDSAAEAHYDALQECPRTS